MILSQLSHIVVFLIKTWTPKGKQLHRNLRFHLKNKNKKFQTSEMLRKILKRKKNLKVKNVEWDRKPTFFFLNEIKTVHIPNFSFKKNSPHLEGTE